MKLTKPQYILYFMQIASKSAGCLTSTDRIALLQAAKADGVFKDKKAFSNALHQLAKDKYIVKEGEVWYMTDSGYDYIVKIWQDFNASHEDEDAVLDEEVKTETDALLNEVERLQESLKFLKSEKDAIIGENAKLKKIADSQAYYYDTLYVQHERLRKMYDDVISERKQLQAKLDALQVQHDALFDAAHWVNVAQQFANVARSFQR